MNFQQAVRRNEFLWNLLLPQHSKIRMKFIQRGIDSILLTVTSEKVIY